MALSRLPASTHRLRRRSALATVAVPLLVLVAACSGSGGGAAIGGGANDPTTTTLPPIAPLTGLPTDADVVSRPAVTVKIENAPASRPQAGLERADVVFEVIVEGGVTRFLAVFHSADSDAGPIRSVRPADPAIVSPFGGVVAFSGGIGTFVDALRASPATAIDETAAGDAMRRRRDRTAPHNLYAQTEDLRELAPDGEGPPPPFATFLGDGQAFAAAGATDVLGVDMVVGRTGIAYTWDEGSATWLRDTNGTPHVVESGEQIAPTTVIVQFVENPPVGEVDTTGSPVTEARVVGEGRGMLFTAGQSVPIRWAKPSATAMTTFTDEAGQPIVLPPGRTWVELADVGDAVTPRLPPAPAPPG